MKRALRNNLLLALASGAVALLLAEVLLQLANYPATPPVGWKWDESPYRSPANANDRQVNQLGLRGANIAYDERDFVVVLLGDSQVEAGTQAPDKLPEALLQNALIAQTGRRDIKVFSVASAGWGNDQELVWLKNYFDHYRADLVVNWLTPVNDYWENTFIDRSVTLEAGRLKPTFRPGADGSLGSGMPATLDWKLKNLAVLGAARILRGASYTLEQYYLYSWLKSIPSPLPKTPATANCPANEVAESALIGSFMQGSRAYTLVTDENIANGRSHFSPFLQNPSPRDDYAVQITHRLLQENAAVANAHGAGFFMFHPYRHDLDAAFREIQCVKASDGKLYPYDGSDWLRHLKATSLASQLLTVNIEAPYSLASGPNDWHFNAEGNQKAMQALAGELVKRVSFAPKKP